MDRRQHSKKIEHLVSLFFTTGRLIKERSGPREDMDPVSMLSLEALRVIDRERPTMKRLAEHLHVTAPSVTSMVRGLLRSGYVARHQGTTDRRVAHMVITGEGKQFLKEGTVRMTKKMKDVLSVLQEDTLDNFIQIMEEIKNAYK